VVKARTRWLYLIAVLAAGFVAASVIAAAIRQDSWGPVASVGWMPAVILATWPGASRRCLGRRRGSSE
jgi:hypothetical protein